MAQLRALEQSRPTLPAFLIVLVSVLIALAASALVAEGGGEEVRGAVVFVVLTLTCLFIFGRAARNDPGGSALFTILLLAWLAKLGFMSLRMYLIFRVYHSGDAFQYNTAGKTIAALLASGETPELTRFWGTQFIELVTGVLYFLTGPSLIGAFLVFTFLSLIGMLLYYKAFVTAFPGSDRRLFTLLLFFYPSMLFWPSSLGKDALMAFFLGLVAFGAARLYRAGLSVSSLLLMLVGLGGTVLIRPHIAAIVAVGLAAVALLRPIGAGLQTPVIRLAGFIAFAGLAVLVVRTSASFLHIEELSVGGVTEFIEERQGQTETGGSAFEVSVPGSPQGFGLTLLTVLFRPFPWEAHNPFALVAALEGVVLFGLLVRRFRGVARAIGDARHQAYLSFTVVYVAIFIFFFSAIANFGILARQRPQVLPFIFMWLAYQRSHADQQATAV